MRVLCRAGLALGAISGLSAGVPDTPGGSITTAGSPQTGTIIDNDTSTTVGPASVQYSDKVTLSATIGTGMGSNVSSGTVTFSIYVGSSNLAPWQRDVLSNLQIAGLVHRRFQRFRAWMPTTLSPSGCENDSNRQVARKWTGH